MPTERALILMISSIGFNVWKKLMFIKKLIEKKKINGINIAYIAFLRWVSKYVKSLILLK